ncbi:MAG: trehalose-6-phosphate synthase [Geminicoccaceae bacterium]
MAGRLVIVSNRVDPPAARANPAGGLAVGVRAAFGKAGGLWFGWSGEVTDGEVGPTRLQRSGPLTYALTDLTAAEHDGYYAGFANRALWPAFHSRLDLASFERSQYDVWRQVNRRFATELAASLGPDDRVWVHDYHLIPLGRELRRLGFAGRLGFFLHIPFPPRRLFQALPWHRSIAEDMCGYDIVGFQSHADVDEFESYVQRELEGHRDEAGLLQVGERRLQAEAIPIGIDVDDVVRLANSLDSRRQAQALASTLHGRALILGVDRLDYSKGIPDRLRAFDSMLREHADWKGKTTLIQICAPSREDVQEYQDLRRAVERRAGHINGRHGDAEWTPVRYVNRSYNRRTLAGFFRLAKVGLVTPLRDGLNLVAEEFVAAQLPDDPGVLVLSRFAGAAEILQGAVIVNPYDVDMTAAALNQALAMPIEERRDRHARMLAAVRANDVHRWRDRFLAALEGRAEA